MKYIKRFLLGLSTLLVATAVMIILMIPLYLAGHNHDHRYLFFYSPALLYYVYLIGKDLEKK